jgi:hypothetical protein
MKLYLRTARAVLVLFLAAVSSSAQTPTMDAVNFKGTTNIFVSRHGLGAPASSCTGIFEYIQDDDTTGQPIWVCQAGTMVHTSGGIAPTFTPNQGVAANAGGLLATTPESGYSSTTGVTLKAWVEDKGLGLFDCRDTKYSGGCLGGTPGLAMQALANDVTCYQAMTGLRANVIFPPGTIAIGTSANPTLAFPTGAHYASSSPNPNGVATTFQATYNGHLALHFMVATTATCADGNVHTNTLTNGYYGGGIGVHGCAQGGCVNVPGDTNGYPNGGQNQDAILIEDSGGLVDMIGAYENGGDGLNVAGESTHVGTVWVASNMAWYYFGIQQSGQTYNPTTDGWHCNVELNSLDGTFPGPFETGGFLQTPGAEYGHVCGAFWGGGNSHMGSVFSNRDEIGLVRPFGNNNGRVIGGRIDAPMGEGILSAGGGNSFTSIDNSSACSGFSTVSKGTVFGPWIATLGSGMTNGTYVVHGVNHAGDTTGSGATLTVTVSGGIATGITVSNPGTLYLATPTFTMTGTGGTPATIGATTYQHCSKLDESSGGNSYVGVKNIFESFFGTDHSTGDIWTSATSADSIFDRTTVGNFERVTGLINEPKGIATHRDLPDLAQPNGGVAATGPGPDFSQGNHFISADPTATSWTGPFTVGSIMQDIWIYGGNPNTTLPASIWNTCSGYDLNLGTAQWYHFFVYRDDVFFGPGQDFIFKEQCDTIDQNHWWVNHAANSGSLPPLAQQGTVDSMGDIRSHAIPALAGVTGSFGGTPDGVHGFPGTFTYAYRVWGPWGTQTSALSATINQCIPAPGFVNNPCFQTLIMTLPEGWTRYSLYRESSTDTVATAGLIDDVTATTPQHAIAQSFPDTRIAPINGTTIGSGNYTANVTGGPWECGTLPPVSAYPAILGQTCVDPVGGYYYHADATDHWKRSALPFSNF